MPGSTPRAAVRILLLLLLFAACVLPHLLSKLLFGRSHWPRRFLAWAGRICGVRISVRGKPVQDQALLICNHVSWLDILALGGATGCAFVSKEELRAHSMLRWLADQNHTIYVRRDSRREAHSQARAVADALHRPRPLAIFPEGTVGPGDQLLPFRSALLSAVTPPPRDVEVRPVAIDYGTAAKEVSWCGESGKSNALRLLGRRGSLPVVLHFLPPLTHRENRKTIAHEARCAIDEALASSRGPAELYAACK